MLNTPDSWVRLSLWVTAPLNLVAAFAFAFPGSGLGQFVGLPADAQLFFTVFSGAMVGLFGCVYLWLALQPEIVRPVLCIGACGKSLAVVTAVSLYAAGHLTGTAALRLCGDLVFVVLWFAYLMQHRATA